MLVNITQFLGLAPAIHHTSLAEGMSVQSENTDPSRGLLEPWKEPKRLNVSVPAGTKTIFKYTDTHWFTWPTDVGCCRVPVPNDPADHVVFTDGDYPKITRNDVAVSAAPYPSNFYRLGIPTPDKPHVESIPNPDWVAPDPAPAVEELIKIDTQYKVTFVDAWGREGAGSLSSDIIEFVEYEGKLKNHVKITLPEMPTGNYNFGSGSMKRIYRTATGSSGGVFMFVAEVPITETTFTDTLLDKDLMEPMISDTWVGPPDDDKSLYPDGPLQHIMGHPNGFLFGHTKHEVCFSEPGTSHAWPINYRHYVEDEIVNAVLLGSDILVVTKAYPVVFSGVHPESMSPIRFGDTAPCLSAPSVTEVAGRVFFASSRGLIAASANGLENVTGGHFTEEQWGAMEPTTMRGTEYNGRYILFTKYGALVFILGGAENLLRSCTLKAEATEPQQKTGELIYAHNNELYQFDAGESPMTYQWQSKTYRLPTNTRFLWCKVIADAYPCEVSVHCTRTNGAEVVTTKTVQNDKPWPLKTGFQGREWWVTATGTNAIRSISLAQHQREFEQ